MTTQTLNSGATPRVRGRWDIAARILTAFVALVTIAMPILGITQNVLIFAAIPLTVILAVRRYGWRTAAAYLVVTFVVANIFENLSITTGFPFGDYHYPGASPRIMNFPIQVAVAYCALGMICWLAAAALLDNADQRLRNADGSICRVNLIALPALAAVLMTLFDLGSDSISSTIEHNWIWEDGGGVFGVPWTNYLGWWFVTYIFFQIFSLVLARRQSVRPFIAETRREPLAMAVAVYFLLAAASMILFFTQDSTTVTDAAGHVWNTGDIYGSLFILNLFGPITIALLAATKLIRGDMAASISAGR